MPVVSVRVNEETKAKMDRLAHVNWSQVLRDAIERKIEEEEMRTRHIDRRRLLQAVIVTDSLRRAKPGWRSEEEIRKWREKRR
ncbi:MAG: VapB-type antitoxin [Candidatus Heimdallarchaeota archaeon]